MLAKCGGQVDFGEEGGSGWAQLILPLRLLLFYKVGDGGHGQYDDGGIISQDQPKNAALVQRLMTHTEEKVSLR